MPAHLFVGGVDVKVCYSQDLCLVAEQVHGLDNDLEPRMCRPYSTMQQGFVVGNMRG
jgi:3-oxoacyl-(acyl-carrier-protein) synthase